jgi:amidase
MTRTVRDAAIMLSFLTGVDPRDEITEESRSRLEKDYTKFLDASGLRGARLGVARSFFRGRTEKLMEAVLEELKKAGAELVDVKEELGKFGPNEYEVLLHDFKADLNRHLAGLGETAPVKTLQDVIEFNERNKEKEMPFFGQQLMLKAQEKGPLTEKVYLDALAACRRMSRDEGIDAVVAKYKVEAIIAPSGGPGGKTDHIYGERNAGSSSSAAAVAGYPSITVPAGYLHGMPYGLSFFGRAYSEPTLLKLAYGFEQATKVRRAPRFLATVG